MDASDFSNPIHFALWARAVQLTFHPKGSGGSKKTKKGDISETDQLDLKEHIKKIQSNQYIYFLKGVKELRTVMRDHTRKQT